MSRRRISLGDLPPELRKQVALVAAKKREAKPRPARAPYRLMDFIVTGGAVILPLRIESVANNREHWTKKARRTKRHRNGAELIPARLLCPPPCTVVLTRIAPRSLDGDNLQSGFKALRDGIADRLGVDDKDPRVEWRYQQEKGRPREYGARVEIIPVNAGAREEAGK